VPALCFNSLFEMHYRVEYQPYVDVDVGFNSLFEMQCSGDNLSIYYFALSFNSLFEMHFWSPF